MEEPKTQSNNNTPMPLVSRLDHLDFILKSLEGKQSSSKGGSRTSHGKQSVPLDLAIREAYFKGSLMDRVAFLERRLFQLSLDMESSSTSSGSGTSSSHTSGYASATNINPNQDSHVCKETSEKEKGNKNSKSTEQRTGNNKPTAAEEKTCKNGRKRLNSKWAHFKILGC